MYKYILFDLDDTLLDFKGAQDVAMASTLEKYEVKATKEILKKYAEINSLCWSRFEKGEITRHEIFKNRVAMFGEFLSVDFEFQTFTNQYLGHLSRQGQTLPFAIELLTKLTKKGYKLAAASNGTLIAQTNRIIVSGLAGFFKEGIFLSEKVGVQKPDPEFFWRILDKIGIQNKSEVLMIGDSVVCDIDGAKAAGIDACLVDFDKNYTKENSSANYLVHSLEEIIEVCNL